MNSQNHGFRIEWIATLAMATIFMNTLNAGAAEEEEEPKEITFPYEINSKNESGPMPNGYHYELWKQTPGTVRMKVLGDEGKFNVEWSNINNFVTRVGLKYDTTKTHAEIGTFTADVAFQKSGIQGSGLAYYGIYGWTVDPLVEYYVMESWDNWRPKAGQGDHISKGTITVDGAQYDVITRQMQNQPSIKGTQSFPQVFSIRQQIRSSGNISVSEHFKQWEKLGINLGLLYEVKIKVESYSENNSSSGSCNVTKAVIKVNGQIPTATIPARGAMAPEYSSFSDNTTAHGVYTLISLNGVKITSITQNPSKPAIFPTDNVAPGLYYLQFRRNGIVPVTKPLLVR